MIFSPILTERAKGELKEIIDWYRDRSEQATENFLIEFNKTVEKITFSPFRYRNVKKHYREILMKKYPYCIVYLADEQKKQIKILTIYHTSRNPENKYRHINE